MGIELSKVRRKKNEVEKSSDYGIGLDIVSNFKSFRTNKLNDSKKEEFYSEITLLLQSGLDLKRSLEIFTNQQSRENMKELFFKIEEKLVKGSSFSDALKQLPEFSAYEYYSIKIGEESGQLADVLSELGSYFQRKLKQQKQLISAFSYPAVIMLTAIMAVMFMMNFIVPLFADAFKRFNSDLPALTRIVVNLSRGMRTYWWLIIIIVSAIGCILYFLRKNEKIRIWIEGNITKLPLIGSILERIYLARFCQSMALMISSKTPLITALELVGEMVGYLPLEQALKDVRQKIYSGKSLNEAMASIPIFDHKVVSLVQLGEETNRLGDIFKKLYEQFLSEADHRTSVMNSLLEPVLLIMVGGLVALILIAMYLPMFKIGNSMI
jgi:type IV pilus assembly protein PilC